MQEVAVTTLAEQANQHHADAQAKAQEAVQHAIEAGRLLTEAKAALPHGAWSAWLADNFEGSDRHARRYMNLATKVDALPDAKRTRVANLPSLRQALEAVSEEEEPNRAYAVLSMPTESRREYFRQWPINLMAYALLLDQAGRTAEEIADALAVDLLEVETMLSPRIVERAGDPRFIGLYRDMMDQQLYFWQSQAYEHAARVAVQEGFAEQAAPCRVLADHFRRKWQRLPTPVAIAEASNSEDEFCDLFDCAFGDARQSIGLEWLTTTGERPHH